MVGPSANGFRYCLRLRSLLRRVSSSSPRPGTGVPPPSKLLGGAPTHLGLEISPDPAEFGTLRPGESARIEVTAHNPAARPVMLERVWSSCPCVRAEGAPARVGANETKSLQLLYDPSSDPDFRGGLSVQVDGLGTGDRLLFRTRVNLDVQAESTSGFDTRQHGTQERGTGP